MKQEHELRLCHNLRKHALLRTAAKRSICSPFPPRPISSTNALAAGRASSHIPAVVISQWNRVFSPRLVMAPTCPSDNTIAVDQSSFWNSGNLNWDEHRIGWAIAGGCTVLVRSSPLIHICPKLFTINTTQTVLISVISVLRHCR